MYRNCQEFILRKRDSTPITYCCRSLESKDEAGFCAAGILLRDSTDRVFMIREERVKDGIKFSKYNFVGGKRDCRRGWFGQIRLETSIETAVAEFEEETGCRIPTKKYDNVFWFPHSKYALFVVRGSIDSAVGKWFSHKEIEEGISSDQFHDYIIWQLRAILAVV